MNLQDESTNYNRFKKNCFYIYFENFKFLNLFIYFKLIFFNVSKSF